MYKERIALVTCMYNGLHGTCYGGRLNRNEFYRESLKTIAEASMARIYCYLPQKDIDETNLDFSSKKHNICFIPFEIDDFPYSAEIQRIKKAYPERYGKYEWEQRCVEIMWGKFFLLSKTLKTYNDIDSIYWIDAGLANTGVISPKYSSDDAIANGKIHELHRAFNNGFFNALADYSNNYILFLTCTTPHNEPIPDYYIRNIYTSRSGVIAGLFGGRSDLVNELCIRFFKLCDILIHDELLFFEEGIMTGILADDSSLFKVYEFNSWYHDGWGSFHDPELVCFNDFIDLIRAKANSESSFSNVSLPLYLAKFKNVVQLIKGRLIPESVNVKYDSTCSISPIINIQTYKCVTFVTSLFGFNMQSNREKPSPESMAVIYELINTTLNNTDHLSLFVYCHVDDVLQDDSFDKASNLYLAPRSADDFRSHYVYQKINSNLKKVSDRNQRLDSSEDTSLECYLSLAKPFLLNDAAILNPFSSDYFLWVDPDMINKTIKQHLYNPDYLLDLLVNIAEKDNVLFIAGEYSGHFQNWIPYNHNSFLSFKVFGGRPSEIHHLNARYYKLIVDRLSYADLYSSTEAIHDLIKDSAGLSYVIHG
jgi:hypothetical protein